MSERQTKQPDYLWGKLFLRPHGPYSWQKGRIDGRVNDDHYLIELFADDNSTHMTIVPIASMTSWRIYDHNEGRAAWLRDAEEFMRDARAHAEEWLHNKEKT